MKIPVLPTVPTIIRANEWETLERRIEGPVALLYSHEEWADQIDGVLSSRKPADPGAIGLVPVAHALSGVLACFVCAPVDAESTMGYPAYITFANGRIEYGEPVWLTPYAQPEGTLKAPHDGPGWPYLERKKPPLIIKLPIPACHFTPRACIQINPCVPTSKQVKRHCGFVLRPVPGSPYLMIACDCIA